MLIKDASVNRAILQHCFFWFGNTGADAAIAILLPTLKRFRCTGAVDWGTTCFCCESVLGALEPWTGAQRALAVKAFYKNGDSFVIAKREFRREFGIHRNRAVPSAHAIKTWVRNVKATDSTIKKKGDSVKTVRTPENIAVVREAIERSPQNCVDFFQWPLSLPQYSRVYVLFLHYYISSLV